jgi:ABC-2 type transport system permease protein
MRGIGRLLPPSYVFDGMRVIVSGGHASGVRLLWGGSLAVLYILAAGAFFKCVHHQAVRSGLIARYSAESVS